jgi:hypothetical protein
MNSGQDDSINDGNNILSKAITNNTVVRNATPDTSVAFNAEEGKANFITLPQRERIWKQLPAKGSSLPNDCLTVKLPLGHCNFAVPKNLWQPPQTVKNPSAADHSLPRDNTQMVIRPLWPEHRILGTIQPSPGNLFIVLLLPSETGISHRDQSLTHVELKQPIARAADESKSHYCKLPL